MRHVEKALLEMPKEMQQFISIENVEYVKGVAPILKFTIQSDPISEVGVNGIQASDIIHYSFCLIKSLNGSFPCDENQRTMDYLLMAMGSQDARTKHRLERGVEGKNEL